jgi:hypothetical protein
MKTKLKKVVKFAPAKPILQRATRRITRRWRFKIQKIARGDATSHVQNHCKPNTSSIRDDDTGATPTNQGTYPETKKINTEKKP